MMKNLIFIFINFISLFVFLKKILKIEYKKKKKII